MVKRTHYIIVTGRTSYEINIQRANSDQKSSVVWGLQEQFNSCFETILTRGTEDSLETEREFFIYLNYILASKYNKGCTHCLPNRYFIYAMAEYLIYFSKNMSFYWAIF